MELSADRWKGMASAEREVLARRLARELPAGFIFQAIRTFQLAESQHVVALYQRDHATFALIPGGVISLGYDSKQPWTPNADELQSWQSTSEEYGIDRTIHEYISDVTLRTRRVELSPFLIETAASELGWAPITADDPEVQNLLREFGSNRQVEVRRGGVSIRVRKDLNGNIVAERSLPQTHANLAALLAAEGFRFPTSDEWEYACGSGASTLFRWSDHVPCDRYPTDVSPAEAEWKRQWALSAGKLERPSEGFTSDWEYHRQPNAFGLSIASNPYNVELVAEIGVTRGGDGGYKICGGMGFFIGWLTLATAYFEEIACKHPPAEEIMHGYTVGRRVLELR